MAYKIPHPTPLEIAARIIKDMGADEGEKEGVIKELAAAIEAETYRALTCQALRMRNEIFRMGGMDRKHFDREYLSNLGRYERKIAREEDIRL